MLPTDNIGLTEDMKAERKRRDPHLPPEVLKGRLRLSEQFLDEVILVQIEAGNCLSPDDVKKLQRHFQEKNPDPGNDFDLAHTWQIAWQRSLVNECLAEAGSAKMPSNVSNLTSTINTSNLTSAINLLEMAIFEE